MLRVEKQLKECIDEAEYDPVCSVAESRRRIKRLAALISKQMRGRTEPTPMVLRGAPILEHARDVDRLETMLRCAIVTKNIALLDTALQQARDLPHYGHVVDLGDEVRKQLAFELEMAKLAAKGQGECQAASARREERQLDRAKFSERVKEGVRPEHHATVREQKVRARRKSIVSTSASVLVGEAVSIEGERHLRNVAGGHLVQKGEANPEIEQRILTMMHASEVFEGPGDDEMVRLMLLPLKRELPSLITKHSKEDKLAFKEFCHTFSLTVCPIFRDAQYPTFTEVPPKRSLTFLEESLERHALTLFQGLLSFMGIRHEPFPETLIEEMVITGIAYYSPPPLPLLPASCLAIAFGPFRARPFVLGPARHASACHSR